jgi:putative lipoic acid-binding regulatory protein
MFDGQELELEFPHRWTYRLIGTEEALLRAAVAEVVAGRDHTAALVSESRTGRYRTLEVIVLIESHDERRSLGQAFHEHPHVRFVL